MEFARAYFRLLFSAALYFKAFLPLAVCIELCRFCNGVVARVCTYVCNTRKVNTREEKMEHTEARSLPSGSCAQMSDERAHVMANVTPDMDAR